MKTNTLRKPASLGATVSVPNGSSAPIVTRSAKCRCGWSAATSGTDVRRTEANLRTLLEAHRRVCQSRLPQS